MNNRERAMAILNYQPYDRMPVLHFGFWNETLEKWANEGHISHEEARGWFDGNEIDEAITKKMGFDFNWYSCFHWRSSLMPEFTPHVVRVLPDGGREVMNVDGVTVLERDEAGSIPAEIEHLLKDRQSWEEHYKPRLQWSVERVAWDWLKALPPKEKRDHPIGLHCGSLWGRIRDITGLVGLSYLMAAAPQLVEEMLETTAELCYQGTKAILEAYDQFDFAHFWEDICYRAGPLVNPAYFNTHVGPYYRKITRLANEHGINIVSLDCDGKIDKLIPTWFENGVNTMFPIEVGVWNASIAPWREQYGRELRGVGGANKVVLSRDYAAIDTEVERLRTLVDLGGYIPCFDHRLPPDAKWENVQYYTERMHTVFGG
jgi:uroporphyrinogen decarboxylase